jgi:uncharacterized protein YndB with AHSA1/START domain
MIEMARIEVSTVIDRPIEEVFAFVSDMTNTPQWSAELVEAKVVSPGPTGVGTKSTSTVKILGRQIEVTSESVEYESNRRYRLEHDAGPVTVRDDWFIFEPVAGGTKVTHKAEIEAGGVFKVAEPIAARLNQRQWETNFAVLKELLEAQAEG